MKRKLFLVVALALVVAVGVGSYVHTSAQLPGRGKTFVLGYGMWTADNLGIHVTKALLEKELGYRVEIAELSVPALFAAMANGQVHAFTNAWFPNQEYLVNQYSDRIEIVSTNFDDSYTGLFVPTWIAEEYNVYTWDDLFRPEVIKLFDHDRDGKGDIHGCDIAWTCNHILDDKLAHVGLDKYYVQMPISEQMVNFELRNAMRTRKPILFMAWTPGWIFSAYPVPEVLTVLEDTSRWHPDDPQGINIRPSGWPPGTSLIAVNHRVKDEHPEAYRLLSQIQIPLQDVNRSIDLQVVEGQGTRRHLDRHAAQWIEENRETVDGWLRAAGIRR